MNAITFIWKAAEESFGRKSCLLACMYFSVLTSTYNMVATFQLYQIYPSNMIWTILGLHSIPWDLNDKGYGGCFGVHNKRTLLHVHQHGGYDVTCKPRAGLLPKHPMCSFVSVIAKTRTNLDWATCGKCLKPGCYQNLISDFRLASPQNFSGAWQARTAFVLIMINKMKTADMLDKLTNKLLVNKTNSDVEMTDTEEGGGGGKGTCVRFCWVCAAGLSEPPPH